jgi:hypothetical protein
MTNPTTSTLAGPAHQPARPRPGSRADRLSHPTITAGVRQIAIEHGVCVRPVLLSKTNEATGQTEVIERPCGSTREKQCPPCAKRAKRLREAQCREGWHRTDEPNFAEAVVDEDERGLLIVRAHLEEARSLARNVDELAKVDEAIVEVEQLIRAAGLRGGIGKRKKGEEPRRKRSTRRRQDAPDLPSKAMSDRTIGRTFTAPNGQVYAPSTFLTATLGSYGRVREDGSPVDPATYDYRRAAWDAVHFPALLDRFFQNLRRAEGWNVQYFGTIEPQRRLAPHAHFAIRGTIPHTVMRQVVAGTYHQVWWPSTNTVVYDDDQPQPVWDAKTNHYVDPTTRKPLPTWLDAMAQLDDQLDADPDRQPEHVIRFGAQVKPEGVLGGGPEADRLIGYLSKYLTKSVADVHACDTMTARAHQRRLWEELRVTPCSPKCASWLRYGIQPKNARAKMRAGHCKGKVHQYDTLAIGGRRVLVSRDWSGKTLADHRYDQLAWVRRLLKLDSDEDQAATDDAVQAARDGQAPDPIRWSRVKPGDPGVPDLTRRLLRAISVRLQQRAAIQAAQAAAGAEGPPENRSATAPPEGRAA